MTTEFVVVGAGGLGGPIALALADAGADSIRLFDDDVVELSNLQRQVQFSMADIGSAKVDALAARIGDSSKVIAVDGRFDAAVAHALPRDRPRVFIDGSDDVATKFATNDSACARGDGYVIAGVTGYRGQFVAGRPGVTGCYRCLFEGPADDDSDALTCANAGVFGAAVAIVAGRAARAALDIAARTSDSYGLFTWDDLSTGAPPRQIQFRPRNGCAACAPAAHQGDNNMATVRIPTPLRKLTEGKEEVVAAGGTVGEVLTSLEASYPGIKDRICGEDGKVRRFVNIFANDEDIRFLSNLDTPVKDGDEVSIIPAIAGGR